MMEGIKRRKPTTKERDMPNEYVNNLDALRHHIASSDLLLEHEIRTDAAPGSDEFLTLEEAAELSGKGRSTIRRWRRDGLLTKYPVRIRKEELVTLLGSSIQKETSVQKDASIQKQTSVRPPDAVFQEEVARLKQELAVSKKREQDSLSTIEDLRWSNSDMSATMNKALDSLNTLQQDLRASAETVSELRDRQVLLEKTEILYLAECRRGFFGRLFNRPLPLSAMIGE